MHIALICPEMHGHLNPMATLGQELARRGHRVSLIGSPRAQSKADACGFGFLPIGVQEHESGAEQDGIDQLACLKGLAALRLTGQLLRDQATITLRDSVDLIRSSGVEAMVVDQVSPAGAAVADTLKLPFVLVCNALALQQEPGVPPAVLGWRYRTHFLAQLRNRFGNLVLQVAARSIRDVVNEFRSANGLPPYQIASTDAGLAQIAQQPAFFDYPRRELPAHFHYTGPWHAPDRDSEVAPFPWERLDGRPLVYASLGTLQNRLRHVFQAILDGGAQLPVQVVLSLGRKDATWEGPVPANAIVVPFAPQLSLLKRASVLITHAGLNTALEGLSCGLPMLCLPVTNDQPGVARRIEWLGVGEVLNPARATAKRVRGLVEKLLGEESYRTVAARCRDQMKEQGGVVRAADIIEEAFRTRQRVERCG